MPFYSKRVYLYLRSAIRFQKSFKIIFPRLHPICCSYPVPVCAIIRSWLWARWFDLTVALSLSLSLSLACTDVYRFKIITNAMCFSIYQSAHYVPRHYRVYIYIYMYIYIYIYIIYTYVHERHFPIWQRDFYILPINTIDRKMFRVEFKTLRFYKS